MVPEDIWHILPNFHFMVFDRYEIHIQAFVDSINGKFIIFLILIFDFSRFRRFKISKFQDIKISKIKNLGTRMFRNFRSFRFSYFQREYVAQHGPIYFLICFEVFCYSKGHKYGVNGSRIGHS